ncbi:hypothetical protein E4U36_000507, partial [Claviceps purpurea]
STATEALFRRGQPSYQRYRDHRVTTTEALVRSDSQPLLPAARGVLSMPQPGAGRKLSLQQRVSPSECLLRQHIHARLRPAALSPELSTAPAESSFPRKDLSRLHATHRGQPPRRRHLDHSHRRHHRQ